MIDAIVTGAGGFLGGALAHKLSAQNQKIIALTRADGDVADEETWRTLPKASTVFHLAGRSYVPDSWQQPAEFIRTNALGTQQALDYCRKYGASLILASAYVYGIPEQLPISEAHTPHPNNPYALSKLVAEQLGEFAAGFHGVPVTVLRIFNIYGRGQRPEFLIPIILSHIKKRETIQVQDLSPRRDYVYLEDVLDAFLRTQRKAPGFRRINIGSGESYSVKEIIDLMQAQAKTNLPVTSSQQERPNEIPDVRADISLARRLLDWSPQYGLKEGIRHLMS